MKFGMHIGVGPGHICYMETHIPGPKGAQTPNFWPIFVVAKRLDG